MGPEQIEGRPVDGRSDVFALGAVLVPRWRTGQRSFGGDTTAGIASSVLRVGGAAAST